MYILKHFKFIIGKKGEKSRFSEKKVTAIPEVPDSFVNNSKIVLKKY